MKFDKITQSRFLILDWCLSDKEHKYTYEELTARMAEALFGDSPFSILPNLVDDDINAIQNYIAFDTQIISYPMEDGGKCYYGYEDPCYRMFYYNPQNEMLPFHKTKCSETQNEMSSL